MSEVIYEYSRQASDGTFGNRLYSDRFESDSIVQGRVNPKSTDLAEQKWGWNPVSVSIPLSQITRVLFTANSIPGHPPTAALYLETSSGIFKQIDGYDNYDSLKEMKSELFSLLPSTVEKIEQVNEQVPEQTDPSQAIEMEDSSHNEQVRVTPLRPARASHRGRLALIVTVFAVIVIAIVMIGTLSSRSSGQGFAAKTACEQLVKSSL